MLIRSHHSLRQAELGILSSWAATLDAAVNKRDLSTGETGELVLEDVGYDLNPGVDRALPRIAFSNQRNCARKYPRNVGDNGGFRERCCQQERLGYLGLEGFGSPKTMVSNSFSSDF